MAENDVRTAERLTEIEIRLEQKLDRERYWLINGPILLLLTAALGFLGYFDIRRIPERVNDVAENQISEELPIKIEAELSQQFSDVVVPMIQDRAEDEVETALDSLVKPAAEDAVASQLASVFGEKYERSLRQLAGISTGIARLPARADRSAGGSWEEIDRIPVEFQNPYKNLPTVFLSVSGLEVYPSSSNIPAYRFEVDLLTEAGFEIRVLGAYLRSMTTAQVHWLALEQ